MKNELLQYKNYEGSINWDLKDGILYGKIEFIRALINYQAKDLRNLQIAFQEAVDDYLDFCKTKEIEPEKPFKGGFNVRVGEARHRKAWLIARELNTNLNEYICSILDRDFERFELSKKDCKSPFSSKSVNREICQAASSQSMCKIGSNKEKKKPG